MSSKSRRVPFGGRAKRTRATPQKHGSTLNPEISPGVAAAWPMLACIVAMKRANLTTPLGSFEYTFGNITMRRTV